jgi:hypothetical protein
VESFSKVGVARLVPSLPATQRYGPSPFRDQAQRSFRQFTQDYRTGLDVNDSLKFAIHRVEMWTTVLAIEDANDDSKKPGQFGHILNQGYYCLGTTG